MGGNTDSNWVLVLAGGEGSRLRSLTTSKQGDSVPKQFCSLDGGSSLLQETLHRAETVASPHRICAVVAAHHRRWWEEPLQSLPASNRIVQPASRGTGIGILLPLLHMMERDQNARVVLLPCDHHVRDEAILACSLRQAVSQLQSRPDHALMLGIEPEDPGAEFGYIVPGCREDDAVSEVEQFVEKPTAMLARELIDRGGLWNAFIIAATGHALLRLFERRYPDIVMDMRGVVQRGSRGAADPIAVVELYERLPQIDFSRHVLEGQEASLRVLRVPPCGWSDLGTPERVAETLRRVLRTERLAVRVGTRTVHLNLAAQQSHL